MSHCGIISCIWPNKLNKPEDMYKASNNDFESIETRNEIFS